MQNSKGRIELRKVDLMGYTPETQVYFIQNAGGRGSLEVSKFLQANKRHFDLTQHMGQVWYALKAGRIASFRDYAERNGFEVAEGRAA